MYSFFLPIIPPTITQQQHAIKIVRGKPVVYDPAELKQARALFMDLNRNAKHRVEGWDYLFPLDGPLRLITKWLFPRGAEHADGEWKITPPDTDNLVKLFKDCMTRTGWWRDDAQVCSEITEKFYAERPGIYVRVEQIGNYDED